MTSNANIDDMLNDRTTEQEAAEQQGSIQDHLDAIAHLDHQRAREGIEDEQDLMISYDKIAEITRDNVFILIKRAWIDAGERYNPYMKFWVMDRKCIEKYRSYFSEDALLEAFPYLKKFPCWIQFFYSLNDNCHSVEPGELKWLQKKNYSYMIKQSLLHNSENNDTEQ